MREMVIFYITERLLKRFPKILCQHFIECIFHYNCYEDHETYNRFSQSNLEKEVFSLAGREHSHERHIIYHFMLDHMPDDQRFMTTQRLCQDVLGVSSLAIASGCWGEGAGRAAWVSGVGLRHVGHVCDGMLNTTCQPQFSCPKAVKRALFMADCIGLGNQSAQLRLFLGGVRYSMRALEVYLERGRSNEFSREFRVSIEGLAIPEFRVQPTDTDITARRHMDDTASSCPSSSQPWPSCHCVHFPERHGKTLAQLCDWFMAFLEQHPSLEPLIKESKHRPYLTINPQSNAYAMLVKEDLLGMVMMPENLSTKQ
ncbi:hypothetical protein O3P69_012677 [Scylla paramamosain]|uniref:Uncharacterized protein n=1 Tax=Scylla paramamosain TaxID=85552 RepID=A0AAW0SCJ8_SCYPA